MGQSDSSCLRTAGLADERAAVEMGIMNKLLDDKLRKVQEQRDAEDDEEKEGGEDAG